MPADTEVAVEDLLRLHRFRQDGAVKDGETVTSSVWTRGSRRGRRFTARVDFRAGTVEVSGRRLTETGPLDEAEALIRRVLDA